MNRAIVDLDSYRSGGSQVFAGRERGQRVREAAQLDKLDHQDCVVEIHVPSDVFSINSSFFLGMFGPSIRHLGADEFRRRYVFVGEDLEDVVEEGIREATSSHSPL